MDKELKLERELPQIRVDLPEAGLLAKFKRGLSKTRHVLIDQVVYKFVGDKDFEQGFVEPLTEKLLLADVGVATVDKVIERLNAERRGGRLLDIGQGLRVVEQLFCQILTTHAATIEERSPTVIFLIGVNGVGKTTTIGKLAHHLTQQKKKVLLAAADTFRAAAVEQLKIWAERTGAQIHSKAAGSDPSAVIYESIAQGIKAGMDYVLCDTSGRLQNKKSLMDELAKMQRTAQKLIPAAPHYTWLVLDANTGQNAISQTREFHQAHAINGLIMTKLDGTARGGILLGLAHEFQLPIPFVGLGEKAEDLSPFNAEAYVQGLLQS